MEDYIPTTPVQLLTHVHSSSDNSCYVTVNVRLYVYFDELHIATFEDGKLAVKKIEPKIDSRTKSFMINQAHMKTINSLELVNILNWQKELQDMLSTYVNRISNKYKISLDDKSISYDTQFCWDINCGGKLEYVN